MNLNKLAVEICEIEGGKQELSIAQVKEVLKKLGTVLAQMTTAEAMALVAKLIK